jgi:hypothetical protein
MAWATFWVIFLLNHPVTLTAASPLTDTLKREKWATGNLRLSAFERKSFFDFSKLFRRFSTFQNFFDVFRLFKTFFDVFGFLKPFLFGVFRLFKTFFDFSKLF